MLVAHGRVTEGGTMFGELTITEVALAIIIGLLINICIWKR